MLRVPLLLCVVPALGIIVKDPPPSPNDYKYSYDIQDPTTGDCKSQHEVRQGDIITGAYSVVGPDGTKRTVEYTADPTSGFKAVISEEPINPPPVVTQAPVIQYQPVTSFDLNALLYKTSSVGSIYTPVQKLQPKTNYIKKSTVFFTPQTQIEHRLPFEGGNYFIPANKY